MKSFVEQAFKDAMFWAELSELGRAEWTAPTGETFIITCTDKTAPQEPQRRVSSDKQRLNAIATQRGTHEIIHLIDSRLLSEPEKLASFLAAVYVQKTFMAEQGGWLADAIPLVEKFHQDTMEALKSGS
jgi:hypothetical protein